MTSAEMIPAVILKKKAVVYVRQSTQSQVMTNLESKRRQYDLVDVARQHGFVDVEIIDDDLGRSASGTVARPGFDRWSHGCAPGKSALSCASMLPGSRETVAIGITCLNCVGLSKPASLISRASIIPCRPNDRLLLGMKGSISEFELGVLRTQDVGRRPVRRPAGASCACRFPSATSGTGKQGLALIPI